MDAKLEGFSPEARSLLEGHRQNLIELPAAFRPLVIRQLRAWPGLFPPERSSVTRLLRAIKRLSPEERNAHFRALDSLSLPDIGDLDPLLDEEKLLDRCLKHFKKNGTYQTWRLAVDDAFQRLNASAGVDPDSGCKLVFVILGEGTGRAETLDDPDRRFLSYFWNHLEPLGTLFTSVQPDRDAKINGQPFVTLFRQMLRSPQIKSWAIDTGTVLEPGGEPGLRPIWFSYEHLRPVMDRVTRKIADTMLSGVRGPEALYARVTDFKFEELGLAPYEDSRIQKFIEQVILQGSGALVINNTFAEWAAIQALRRVEPDLLMVRFGARRRFVPLRQLDPFQTPSPRSEDLRAEDPGESLQDADVLSYYIWLETRKNARYRDRTFFLIYFEGSNAALFSGPGILSQTTVEEPVRLVDFASTLAHLLRDNAEPLEGRVLERALAAKRPGIGSSYR